LVHQSPLKKGKEPKEIDKKIVGGGIYTTWIAGRRETIGAAT